MVIDLTSSEKNTFVKFLGLYLGASFVLLVLIAILYYANEKKLYFDLVRSNMQNTASSISSKIVLSHMMDTKINMQDFLKSKKYKISFYDKKKNKLFGNINEKIDLEKQTIRQNKYFIITDKSALGHLGVYFIAVKENIYDEKMQTLKANIILFFFGFYFAVFVVGYYLAKLFLQPIKNERIKLNNFIKDTTHELNTPISAILMSSEASSLSTKQVERIRLSVNRISEIYKDLSYIIIEDNNIKRDIRARKIHTLIKEQLEYFEPLISKKQINLKVGLEEFEFDIDKDDFTRLFNNIVSNSIKYTNQNGTLNIKLEKNKLIIQDTGMGIEKSKLDDIFKRYFRATTQKGGFGLGLSIVKNICNFYDISIDVKSELSKGTTFVLRFI